MEWLVVKTVLSLGAVLGLMFVLVLLLRKFVYRGRAGAAESVEIEVLGQRMLQPRRSVYVLRIMDKIVVVGMSEHGMHTLTELSGSDVTAELATRRETAPARQGWTSWLNQGVPGAATFAGQLQHAIGAVRRKGTRRPAVPDQGGEQ